MEPIHPAYKVTLSKQYDGPKIIEGYLKKLKSPDSKKYFSDEVKRYFILDLNELTISYKIGVKDIKPKHSFSINDLKQIHRQSNIVLKGKLAKEWPFDFMLEFKGRDSPLILLASNDQLYSDFMVAFEALNFVFEKQEVAQKGYQSSPQIIDHDDDVVPLSNILNLPVKKNQSVQNKIGQENKKQGSSPIKTKAFLDQKFKLDSDVEETYREIRDLLDQIEDKDDKMKLSHNNQNPPPAYSLLLQLVKGHAKVDCEKQAYDLIEDLKDQIGKNNVRSDCEWDLEVDEQGGERALINSPSRIGQISPSNIQMKSGSSGRKSDVKVMTVSFS